MQAYPILRYSLVLILSLLLISCSSFENKKEVTLTTYDIISKYNAVRNIVALKINKFDKTDQALIRELDHKITSLIDQLENYDITTNYGQLYSDTILSYAIVRQIIIDNESKFAKSESKLLHEFDNSITKLNTLFSDPDNLKVAEIINVIKTVLDMSLTIIAAI